MTTLYRPVLIESAEQAAQMPVRTLARNDYADPLEKWETTYGETHWGDAGDGLTDADMVGWTALVPIEAEEEWTPMVGGHAYVNGKKSEAHVRATVAEWPGAVTGLRLVTLWEEA